jgi:uncharacterized OB-fold protein
MSMMVKMQVRPTPVLTERTRPFWTGGADGVLLIERCQTCGRYRHPPAPVCAECHGRELAPEAVSGRATVWSFTVNRYPWAPGIEPPYVLAEVELEEQAGLRLLTAIVDCDEVTIGMPVSVRFEVSGDAWIPVFAP